VPYPLWLSLLEDAVTQEKKPHLRASRLIPFFRSRHDPMGSFKTDMDRRLPFSALSIPLAPGEGRAAMAVLLAKQGLLVGP
jgi:hypothetical protein